MRTTYPPSSVNAPFHGYSKLQLHGTEESRNRRRSNEGDRTGDPPAQKAAHQPSELRLLLKLLKSVVLVSIGRIITWGAVGSQRHKMGGIPFSSWAQINTFFPQRRQWVKKDVIPDSKGGQAREEGCIFEVEKLFIDGALYRGEETSIFSYGRLMDQMNTKL